MEELLSEELLSEVNAILKTMEFRLDVMDFILKLMEFC